MASHDIPVRFITGCSAHLGRDSRPVPGRSRRAALAAPERSPRMLPAALSARAETTAGADGPDHREAM